MNAIAGLSAAIAALVALLVWRSGLQRQWAHPVMAGLVGLTTFNAGAHMVLSSDPQESVSFLLVLVGAGTALLSHQWFFGMVAAIWLSWGLGAVLVGGTARDWGQWMLFMLTATVLGIVINMVRRSSIDVAAEAVRAAERAATEDPVTGLHNRRGLALLGREVVGVARRSSDAVHCSFLDVDGLKAVNDGLGHDAGDRVIEAVAKAIKETSRSTDVLARWGGDEFVVIGLGSGLPPRDLERRIHNHLARQQSDDPALAMLRISVGRSLLEPWDEGGLERLVWAADRDMYVRRATSGRLLPNVFTVDGTFPPSS